AELSKMGKKKLDRTAHDGFIIVTRDLASAIEREGFTGIAMLPARRRSPSTADAAYRALSITSTWPPLAASARIDRHQACPVCRRAGYFDLSDDVTELHYGCAPHDAADWNHTWEYFGDYRRSR